MRRVAGAIAGPSSHRTGLVLFTSGSSGKRVINLAPSLAALIYPNSESCFGALMRLVSS